VGVKNQHVPMFTGVADVEQFGADVVLDRTPDERTRLLAVVAYALGTRVAGAVPRTSGSRTSVAVSMSPRWNDTQARRNSSMSLADMSAVLTPGAACLSCSAIRSYRAAIRRFQSGDTLL
jgi:hypothetical protein